MRLYNRSIMRKRVGDIERWTITDRDAVVWSVDTSNFYALVKVQGSGTLIKAHYPRNYRVLPTWLKPGNSVRIRHRSGAQGFVEVIGHGRAIPTPVAGGSLPPPTNQSDGIIWGMAVLVYGGMNVTVSDGAFRINGAIYLYFTGLTGYIVMDDPAPMIMGNVIKMGSAYTVTPIAFDAPPAVGFCRYDALFVGTDSVIDYVAGAVGTVDHEPSFPSIPTDHVLIAYIFVYGGMGSITAADIGGRWTLPAPTYVGGSSAIKQSDGTYLFPWSTGGSSPTVNVTVQVTNQYTQPQTVGATVTVTMLYGSGDFSIDSGANWYSMGQSATRQIGTNFGLTYRRDQLLGTSESGPLFRVDFAGHAHLSYILPIIIIDEFGGALI